MRTPIIYRELSDMPDSLREGLAAVEPIALAGEGEPRALLIPVTDGDVETALDAWQRGRALLALRRLQGGALRSGTADLDRRDILAEIGATRARQ